MQSGCVLEPVISGNVPDDHPSRTSPVAYRNQRQTRIAGCCHSSGVLRQNMDPILDLLFLRSGEGEFDRLRRKIYSMLERLYSLSPPVSSNFSQSGPQTEPPFYLFNEHYVIKPPQSDWSSFGWHTDAAEQLAMCFHQPNSIPYISLWCPLDKMTKENGTLRMAPGSHVRIDLDENTFADGSMASICVYPEPGDIVLFSSTLWHCSEPNKSSHHRRAYYLQYSLQPITHAPCSTRPIAHAIPVPIASPTESLKEGESEKQRKRRKLE